ncbi:MAG: hypothetical protein J6A42_10250 [Firmicutes bacterium]|nr:hypothetical protein [Bacillota bacterium]
MDERARKQEKLKNAVIVVLFLTTILLLNLTWRSEGQGSFRLSSVLDFISEDVWVPEANEFVTADSAVYGFGDATFSRDRENADRQLQDVLDLFRRESANATFLINEVTDQQYRDMLRSYRSLKVCLSCPVPFGEYCDQNGINRNSTFDQVQTVDAFLISEAAPESIFVEGNGQCWRFISDSEESLAGPLLASIDRSEPIHYTAGSMLGGENLSLLPLAQTSALSQTAWESEASDDAERTGREMAESVFGENFDFVRRITDSFGNVTYMYGYGEKTLTCLTDGTFEYKTETAEGPDPGFYGSLQTAIAFTATHGGWGNDRRDLSYVLCEAKESGSGRSKIYTFGFAQVLDGLKLLSEEGPAITVTVSGGEVSYYRRAVAKAAAAAGEEQPAAEAANVIAGNSHLIYSVLTGNVLTASSDEEFAYVADHLKDAYIAYVVTEDSLRPAWVVKMEGDALFFFGLYDALPLGFTRE